MADLIPIVHKIVAEPRIYDLVQKLAGSEICRRRLESNLHLQPGQLVLDVGAGTGNWRCLVPSSSAYVWLDIDTQKLAGFRSKTARPLALLSDAARLGVRNASVDHILCVAVTHHISDPLLPLLFAELARTCRETLVFLDPIGPAHSMLSRLLWKYDRGSFPRSGRALCNAISQSFQIERVEYYTIYHRYLLCVARPLAVS